MNVHYRVELNQAERAELTTLLSGGIRLRRKTAGWDDEYLASLIAA